ncbi:MAG: fasciclin domain-containing protein, partial [Phycisphaerales bacterium]|nr:fasciclin domain-containing protein [Phycisphaerales bacterium]
MLRRNLLGVLSIAALAFGVSTAQDVKKDEPKKDTPPATAAGKNIVETAKADKQFSTLVSLLAKADLAATLEGAGPFTVFAPTDDAFKKLDPKTLEDLQKPE